MARTYSGSGSNYIQCDVGACGPAGTGAFTVVSLIKLDLFAGASALWTGRVGSSNARDAIVTGHLCFGAGDFSSGFGPITEDEWWWIVEQKVAGAAHLEWAIGKYPVTDPDDPDPAVGILFGESSGSADHTDPGTLVEIWLGEADIRGRGTHALHAMFNNHLTQAQIKSGLTTALADLMALTAAGCWPLNQASSSDPVVDVTGGGADEVATIGTVGVGADPPGYNFAISAAVTVELAGVMPSMVGAFAADLDEPAVLAGVLPRLVGALTADLDEPAILTGVFQRTTGSMLAAVDEPAVLAGVLPRLVGHLTAAVDEPAVLAGVLPRLAAAVTAVVDEPGVIAGVLPRLAGAFTADVDEPAVLAGVLPRLVAQLQVSTLEEWRIAGQLPRLVGHLTAHCEALVERIPPMHATVLVRGLRGTTTVD